MVIDEVVALQLPVALTMVTAVGPVIWKSEPSVAIEAQSNGSVKFIVMKLGAQPGSDIVPIGSGGCGATVNEVVWPAVTDLLQAPVSVLPSEPTAMAI